MNICDARPTELTEEMKRFGVKLDDFGVYFSCGFDVGRTEEKTLTLKGFGNSCTFFYTIVEETEISFSSEKWETILGLCSEIQQKDDLLFNAMSLVRAWEITDKDLVLKDVNGEVLFRCYTEDKEPVFEESQWFITWVKE